MISAWFLAAGVALQLFLFMHCEKEWAFTSGSQELRVALSAIHRWSYLCGAVAVVWILCITGVFVLPTILPVTYTTLNYAGPAVGALLLGTLTWWAVHARTWFTGRT